MESKPSFWRTLVRERKIKTLDRAQSTFEAFSITEKAIFLGFGVIFIGSALSLATQASAQYTVDVPNRGGSLTEGIIGTPRFINPLLAVSDADRDLTALVYSGLLKASPDGSYIPDLAQDFSISQDGLVYTFTLRDDAKFHDGEPVTADDVRYTIEKAQDSGLKSPRRVNWEGVSIATPDAQTVTFTLRQPYAPFMANLTLGILPRHLWTNLENDQIPFSSKNIDAIGSGPYKIVGVSRSQDDIPDMVSLRANPDYALGEPYITEFNLKFYGSESALLEALQRGAVESASNLTPSSALALEGRTTVLYAPLTRVFGIFFNQNENELLAHKEIRKALGAAIDKKGIIDDVLKGFGSEAIAPLPPTAEEAAADDVSTATTTGLQYAMKILADAKWVKNPQTGELEQKGKTASSTLSLSLSTANVPELVESARKIEEDWTALGAKVDVRVFEPTDLNQGVIRPRKYDALLFGLVTGKNSDLYPFWHSSQRNDPGLNIAIYTNAKVDKALEKMRTGTSTSVIEDQYALVRSEIEADAPAIFLWSPDFIYAVPDKLQGIQLGEITTPSDRYIGVEKWHVETDHVWKIFADKQINDQ